MKVRDVLAHVNEVKPNVFSDARLMDFLNEVESMAWTEALRNDPVDYVVLAVPDDLEKELIIPQPYAKVYGSYIQAMIDFQNEESVSYQNNMEMFNSTWAEYLKYMNRKNDRKNAYFHNFW